MVKLIEIFKQDKKLIIHHDDDRTESFTIGVGKVIDGPKQKRDDMRTPEGSYRVIVKNPKSKYHLSIGLNYPNKDDAKRGLDNQVIDKNTYQAICDAHDNQTRIPWDTELGGEIYIHGAYEERDWSEGCIRMQQEDIENLYAITDVGTEVIIKP